MKILLLNPPYLANYSRQSRSPCVAKSGTIYYSYYLAYAGCALEKAGHEVVFYDSIAFDKNHDETIKDICGSIHPDLILCDTSTPSIVNDINFLGRVKKNGLPSCIVGVCGTFPSKVFNEFVGLAEKLQPRTVDFALLGEYEETVVHVVDFFQSGKELRTKPLPNGVAINDGGSWTDGKVADLVPAPTLDELPFVSDFYLRHLGESGIKKHFYASIQWPYLQILSSRGCPYKCTFCNIPSIGSYRTRSIDSVVAELKYIEDHLPFVREVFFEDDTFPINKKRTVELCEKIIEEKIKLTWSCNARVNTDKEVLAVMKKAGCRLTCVGFESPSKDALKGIIKSTNATTQEKFMNDANEVGMKVNGCFIVGLPGDTQDTIRSTIKYAKKLLPNTAQFYPHMLYPGTESFAWAEKEGLVEHRDYSKWLTPEGFHNTPLRVNNISPEELLALADEGRLSFYTNPKYLWKMMVQAICSPGELIRMLKAGKSFFPILIKYVVNR